MKPLPRIITLSYEVSIRHTPGCVVPNLLVLEPKEEAHKSIDLNILKAHQRLLLDEYLDEDTLVVFRFKWLGKRMIAEMIRRRIPYETEEPYQIAVPQTLNRSL